MFDLVVGVGNPGSEYAQTRHNVAWLFLDYLKEINHNAWKSKFKGLYSEGTFQGQKFYALKPQTYMNLSGESVQPMAAFFKVPPARILGIHDEVALPFGQVHFKMGGGFAGHNGLKSIGATLGTDQYARLRIGIGRPVHGAMSSWVLGNFTPDEKTQLDIIFEKLRTPFFECLKSGVAKVGPYNKKNFLA